MKPRPLFDATALTLGFGFLYLPILVLILFSFTESRLVTVWGGFSTRWYAAVLANGPLMQSALLSLGIAVASAALATVFGTMAAVALARFGVFRGRLAFAGLVLAPMVLPEIVLALSLLLLFVALGLDRGGLTIMLSHATFTIAFVTVVVQARLSQLDPRLEEAAADLGAPPLTAFFRVTLPLIAPAMVAGFLLAFTLSLDDLVIASFVSGPGATTLPMRIYSQARLGVTPEINALSSLMIGVVTVAVIAASVLTRRPDAA